VDCGDDSTVDEQICASDEAGRWSEKKFGGDSDVIGRADTPQAGIVNHGLHERAGFAL
jgi:hypothetical protein